MKALLNNNSNTGSETVSLAGIYGVIAEHSNSRHKIFSTADLWNIRRQTKYRALRRFI